MSEPIAPGNFSRSVDVSRLGDDSLTLAITAEPTERAQLAQAFDLVDLAAFAAEVTLARISGTAQVRLTGRLKATVTQTCVVSLDPVESTVESTFERIYDPAAVVVAEPAAGRGDDDLEDELGFDLEAGDPPDPLVGDRIDVGAAVAEELALSLDPYPRKPGATIPEAFGPEDPVKTSPFAVLRQLRPDQN